MALCWHGLTVLYGPRGFRIRTLETAPCKDGEHGVSLSRVLGGFGQSPAGSRSHPGKLVPGQELFCSTCSHFSVFGLPELTEHEVRTRSYLKGQG